MSFKAVAHPVMKYNPHQYIPIDLFRKQWEISKIEGLNRIQEEDETNAGFFSVISPFVFATSLIVFLPVALVGKGSLSAYLTNPITSVMLVLFVISGFHFYKRIHHAGAERNAADFVVLESVRQYLKGRYGFLPKDWENRLISYLVEEQVRDNRFSKEYQLTVKNYKGYDVVMVTNVDGEAPLKI